MRDRERKDDFGRPGSAQDERDGAPGKRTLTGILGKVAAALGRKGRPETSATSGDVAEAAVEHKGSGAAVDAAVRTAVEPHVGADLSHVRVHSDPIATE